VREKILELLKSLPGRAIEDRGSSVWMVCPNPEHAGGSERTASFKINLESPFLGSCFCFGCAVHGSWKKVTAPLLGLKGSAVELPEIASDSFSEDEEARMLGQNPRRMERGFREKWPRTQAWRSVPGNIIVDVGGCMILHGDGREPMLRLPVVVRGIERTYIDCKINPAKDDERKYFNSDGAATKNVLFPYDWVRRKAPDVLAIVEGPRDALITIRNGLPALATLGSHSWSKRCKNLVLAIAPKTLLILADPDEAGEKLAKNVYRDLSPYMKVVVVNLPSKMEVKPNGVKVRKKVMDPADLSPKQLRKLCTKLNVKI
jgi:5S rRNA maturation endonuclease (ribonuclease M5)